MASLRPDRLERFAVRIAKRICRFAERFAERPPKPPSLRTAQGMEA